MVSGTTRLPLADLVGHDSHKSYVTGCRSNFLTAPYRSAREAVDGGDGTNLAPTYMAVAEGHFFRVIARL